MRRLLFEKTGNAIWISHLDLMRLFQRAFQRAGMQLVHTQGFNPRPSVSIALPLSVGVESRCELLDFDLAGDRDIQNPEICTRLNGALIDGIHVLDCADAGRKIKELAFLDCRVTMEYDNGVPDDALEAIRALFLREQLKVEKKGKSGLVEQDLIPLIRRLEVTQPEDGLLWIEARVCCQNPALNPMQLTAAITRYLPQMQPDFAKYCRTAIYDAAEKPFR